MSKNRFSTLLAVLALMVAGAATAAVTNPEPAPDDTPALATLAAPLPGPVCAEDADVEAVLAEIAPQAAPAATGEALPTDTSWWRGICWTSCWPCNTSANCPWGETCQFGVHCP